MKATHLSREVAAFLLLFLPSFEAAADTFGSGVNTFEIDFVTIDHPGNPPDTSGSPPNAGSVAYVYRIGRYEISRDLVNKANAAGGLDITLNRLKGVSGGPRPEMPATGVSWNEAARFVNWLNTSRGYPPAYKFAVQPGQPSYSPQWHIQLWTEGDEGYDPLNPFRNSGAHFFLPTADEWYKAAFFDPQSGSYVLFPTLDGTEPIPVAYGTYANTAVYGQPYGQGPADITQAGGLSPFGVMGMGGNAFEAEETEMDLVNDSILSDRGHRGGAWASEFSSLLWSRQRSPLPPAWEGNGFDGFRVASVPEPNAHVLGALAWMGLFLARRRSG